MAAPSKALGSAGVEDARAGCEERYACAEPLSMEARRPPAGAKAVSTS